MTQCNTWHNAIHDTSVISTFGIHFILFCDCVESQLINRLSCLSVSSPSFSAKAVLVAKPCSWSPPTVRLEVGPTTLRRTHGLCPGPSLERLPACQPRREKTQLDCSGFKSLISLLMLMSGSQQIQNSIEQIPENHQQNKKKLLWESKAA